MLQQTQVDRVIGKYAEFISAFPTLRALARAPIQKLLRVWSGLGYNRRALYLQKTAQAILDFHEGVFPRNVDELERLPGIGPYTARAVAVFAFNSPEVVLETNIRRVFIHTFFQNARGKIGDDRLVPFIKKAVYARDPHRWYSALMDYGAVALKDIPNPNRKSAVYARQTKFEGSTRYARAYIVRHLLKTPRVSVEGVRKMFQKDKHLRPHARVGKLERLLEKLTKDGFLFLENEIIFLAK